jgi:hypothetical protein
MSDVLTVQIAAPIGGKRKSLEISEPLTLTAIVERACEAGLIDRDELSRLRTYVNHDEVPPDERDGVLPAPGDYVLLYPTPQFETIAMAITAIVAALSPGAITASIISTFGISSLAAAQAIYGLVALTEATALSAAGGLISRALGGSHGSAATTYGISGASNTADPDGICPVVLGKRRVVPRLAASSFTETVGDDVYLTTMVQWSVGPVRLSDLRIGETPLSVFKDVQVQHRLLPTDPWPDLYPFPLREDTYGSLELVNVDGWVQRRTQKDTTEISIDVAFPNGLCWNGKTATSVALHWQYRAVGSANWLDAPVGVGGVVTYTEKKVNVFRRNVGWVVPKGEYDVQALRVTPDYAGDDAKMQDKVYWVCMRSFGVGRPVIGDNFALTVLRIRAPNQLNGQIAELNGIVEALIPTWDAEAGDFIGLDASSNPGDQANWIARGPANARPLTGRVNVANIGAFAETCTAKDWKCDTIIETEMSVEQAMTLVAIAGHGLGVPWEEGKLTVSIDNERPAPAQLFSGRNVRNFTGSIVFPEELHAVNVSFYDEASGYQKEVCTVYADGYDAATATAIEGIHTDVKTDAREAYVLGWTYIQTRTHRPESYEWDCNRTGLVAPWGARVDVAHPRMLVGIRGTRVKQVLTRETDGYVTGLGIDEKVPMEAGKSYVLKGQRGSSIGLLEIVTEPGKTKLLTLAEPVPPDEAPIVGNHCVFGVAGVETMPVLVTGIAHKADQTAHLSCIPYAPELQAEGGEIPPWDPKITPRAMAEPVAVGHVTPTVRRAVDDETIARLANQDRTPPDGSVGPDQLDQTLQQAKEEASLLQDDATALLNEASAAVAQAALMLASETRKVAARATKTKNTLAVEVTKGVRKSTAGITDELSVLADESQALAGKNEKVEAKLFGMGDETGSVAAAISSASVTWVEPFSGVSSTVDTHTAQLSGLGTGTGSVATAISVASVTWVEPLRGVSSTVDTLTAQLSGLGTGTGSVAAAISSASVTWVEPFSGVSSTVDTHTAQLSGLGTGTGSVSAAISAASTAYFGPLGSLSDRVDTLESTFGPYSAASLFRAYGAATGDGAVASSMFTVRASDGVHTAEGGWGVDAVVSGGVTYSRMHSVADTIEFRCNQLIIKSLAGAVVDVFDTVTGLVKTSGLALGAVTDFAFGGMTDYTAGLSIGTAETDFFQAVSRIPPSKIATPNDFYTLVAGAHLLRLDTNGENFGRVKLDFSGFVSPTDGSNTVNFKVYRCGVSPGLVITSQTLISIGRAGGANNPTGGAMQFGVKAVDRNPVPNAEPVGIFYRAIIYTSSALVSAAYGNFDATHYKR